MAASLHVSKVSKAPVYFLREAVTDLKEIVIALEQVNTSGFYLFIDKIESMHNEIAELLAGATDQAHLHRGVGEAQHLE